LFLRQFGIEVERIWIFDSAGKLAHLAPFDGHFEGFTGLADVASVGHEFEPRYALEFAFTKYDCVTMMMAFPTSDSTPRCGNTRLRFQVGRCLSQMPSGPVRLADV